MTSATAVDSGQQSVSGFGHLIMNILTENNGKILAKYRPPQTKESKIENELRAKFERLKEERTRSQLRKELLDEINIRPSITTDAKKEWLLRKIGTRGVVTLFNAVAEHQRQLKRSLDNMIDSDDDILQNRTMRIEKRSKDAFLQTLERSRNMQMTDSKRIHTHTTADTGSGGGSAAGNRNRNRSRNRNHKQQLIAITHPTPYKKRRLQLDVNQNKNQNTHKTKKKWRVLSDELLFPSITDHQKRRRKTNRKRKNQQRKHDSDDSDSHSDSGYISSDEDDEDDDYRT